MAQFVLFLAPVDTPILLVFANFAPYEIVGCHSIIAKPMHKNQLPSLRVTLLADSLVCFLCGGLLFSWPLPLSALLTIGDLTIVGTPFGVFLKWLGAAIILIGAGVYAVAKARVISQKRTHDLFMPRS